MQRDSERIYDEYLAAAARAGDRLAWERLVVRWQPRLHRHAWRLVGDQERALDRVQEAWIEILRGLPGLDDVAAFPAWAYRIVTRRCQRAYRLDLREPESGDAFDDAPEMATPERESAEFAADLGRVLAAMQTLPPEQRAALALYHLDQMGVAEIAIALDVPPGTVKTRLMHARRKLRAQLEGVCREQE